jgi:hypothetical protein
MINGKGEEVSSGKRINGNWGLEVGTCGHVRDVSSTGREVPGQAPWADRRGQGWYDLD